MLRQIEWVVQNGPIKNGLLPPISSFNVPFAQMHIFVHNCTSVLLEGLFSL